MSRRGTYRGIYSSLPDDPDFQQLSPHARLILYTARTCAAAGPGCIFRYYPELLARQSGLIPRRVATALEELVAADWIRIEGPILWIKNGLRYDPSMSLADPRHRKSVCRALESLPRLQIVLTFCDYYDLPRAFEGPSKGHRGGSLDTSGSNLPRKRKSTEEEEEEDCEQVGPSRGLARSARVSPKIPPGFSRWWQGYPKKVGKDAALKAWQAKGCEAQADAVLSGLAKQDAYLTRDSGKYIPNPATWLNQGRWQDEPPVNGHQRGFGTQDMSGIQAFLEAHKHDGN